MTNSEQLKLIKEIKSGINVTQNFNKILDNNIGIFYRMCSKHMYGNLNFYKNDFLPNKESFVYQCILDFNESKNTKFSTYLGNRIKWFCLNLYNKNKELNSRKVELEPEEFNKIECSSRSEKFIEVKDELDHFFKKIKSNKDSRLYKIFKHRYLDGENNCLTPWSEVASNPEINLSVQGCINIHNRYIKQIKKGKK